MSVVSPIATGVVAAKKLRDVPGATKVRCRKTDGLHCEVGRLFTAQDAVDVRSASRKSTMPRTGAEQPLALFRFLPTIRHV
jgi:hypothetical protein